MKQGWLTAENKADLLLKQEVRDTHGCVSLTSILSSPLSENLAVESNDVVACHLARVARCADVGDGLVCQCVDILLAAHRSVELHDGGQQQSVSHTVGYVFFA